MQMIFKIQFISSFESWCIRWRHSFFRLISTHRGTVPLWVRPHPLRLNLSQNEHLVKYCNSSPKFWLFSNHLLFNNTLLHIFWDATKKFQISINFNNLLLLLALKSSSVVSKIVWELSLLFRWVCKLYVSLNIVIVLFIALNFLVHWYLVLAMTYNNVNSFCNASRKTLIFLCISSHTILRNVDLWFCYFFYFSFSIHCWVDVFFNW